MRTPLVAALGSALVVAAVLAPFVTLFDQDSYFHLAVADRYAHGELRGGLEWARLSAMGEAFGDKELLFHLLLAPLVALTRSTLAGKLALVALNALLGLVLARAFSPYLGRWSALAHLAFALTAIDYSSRLLRLRPELVALPLVLLALEAASRGRLRLLGFVSFVFTLSYTGFHVLLILAAGWFAWEALARDRRPWALVAWPALGAAAGIVLHPQFPANVRVWLLQGVLRYFVPLPDAGAEMLLAPSLAGTLAYDGGWLLLIAALWRSGQPRASTATAREAPAAETTAEALRSCAYTVIALALFFVFYLALPARFGLYLVPLGTLVVLQQMHGRGRRVSSRVRLAGGRSLPLPLAVVLALLLGLASVRDLYQAVAGHGCFSRERAERAAAFGRAMPRGARVAAAWADAEWYAFWAPQASYPNVLDPVFLAVPRPDAYRASLALFEGTALDVPLVAGITLESDHLAFSARRVGLLQRVEDDPRLERLCAGDDLLLRLVPGANASFALDWRVAPPGTAPETADAEAIPSWELYPRHPDPYGRALEGFVDQRRLARPPACTVFARTLPPRPRVTALELSPFGPAALWLDGQPLARLLAGTRAVVGRGLLLRLPASERERVLAIESCPAEGAGGFYLLERAGS